MKLILSIVLSFSLFACVNGGEEEVIIVPKGYRGYVLIILNQKNGEAVKYEDKKRVYEIPSNGVLKTQFMGNYGWRGLTEFYYEKIAPENKLPSFAEFKKIPAGIVVGFIGSNGSIKKNSKGEERIEFVQYYIGTKTDIIEAQESIQKLDILKLAEW